ncbi:hypothetical protein GGF37_001027 [Kickxella alabastrina]|nr:hypothetical protein GGF37_001027 [Kickxella alabastrina]
MSAIIAATPGAHIDLCNPANSSTSQLLMRTTAHSLNALLRAHERGRPESNTSTHSLRNNFAHIIPTRPTPTSATVASSSGHLLPSIEGFVNIVTAALNTKTAVLVTALVYVERLRKRLPVSATVAADTPYRVFLAALMLADKFWSDHTVSAENFVVAAGGAFSRREIAAMERALLKLLGFRLYVSADDIRQHARRLGFAIDDETSLPGVM